MIQRETILLGVNVDHAAQVREARYRGFSRDSGQMVEPDPVRIAMAVEHAGGDGITVHLREDRRHIQDGDLWRLKGCLQTRLNLEMACTEEMVGIALELKPEAVCLVPEKREELTTEGGLDLIGQADRVGEVVKAMNAAGIEVSLFIDPDLKQMEKAAALKAPVVEIHTGTYAFHYYDEKRKAEWQKLVIAAEAAHELGLIVNAGHGVNYVNIAQVRNLPWLHELNIGHSIMSRALYSGINEAVAEMKRRMYG